MFGSSVHNQPGPRGKNYKKEEPQLRELRVEALDCLGWQDSKLPRLQMQFFVFHIVKNLKIHQAVPLWDRVRFKTNFLFYQ